MFLEERVHVWAPDGEGGRRPSPAVLRTQLQWLRNPDNYGEMPALLFSPPPSEHCQQRASQVGQSRWMN